MSKCTFLILPLSKIFLTARTFTYLSVDIFGGCRRVHDCFFPCGPRRLKVHFKEFREVEKTGEYQVQ